MFLHRKSPNSFYAQLLVKHYSNLLLSDYRQLRQSIEFQRNLNKQEAKAERR